MYCARMGIYYTSDHHWGHKNILKFCTETRPFDTVEEMDEEMIRRWNTVVKPNDTVYHVGDFALGKAAVPNIVRRLNGSIVLVAGNHDSKQVRNLDCWKSSHDYLEIKDQGQHIVLCHFAMRVWNKSHYGSLMLHGHSHGSLPIINNQSLDVGVDCWDLYPVNLEQIKVRLSSYPPMHPVDNHHQRQPIINGMPRL